LISDVRKNAPDTDAFIFDLLGNSSVRFEQFDGTSPGGQSLNDSPGHFQKPG
jgi:hypothetical protein